MTEPAPSPTLWQSLRAGATGCARGLGELVFPWRCELCEAECRGGPFCTDCHADLLESVTQYAESACPRCGMPAGPYADLRDGCTTCRRRRFRFDGVLALGTYDGPLRTLCLRLKHEPSAWLAPRLGRLLAELRMQGDGIPPDAWVVPVPLHWRRRWKRRYNQAEALAQGIAEGLGLRVRRSLRRVVATPSLAEAGLAPTERVKVMRGAFRVRNDSEIEGRVIVLVDDILTTGATSGEAARVLKKAGASRVVCAVLARAEGRQTHAGGGQDRPQAEHTGRLRPVTPGVTGEEAAMTSVANADQTLKIGTRGSKLARWQAEWVSARLREAHPTLAVELIEIKTQGDRDRNSPLAAIGGTGLFTKEIQRAVLVGSVDIAVHSLKDLPTFGPRELVMGAIPPREDVADALIAPKYKTLEALPPGATVGTGSLRRRAQLLHRRPDLNVQSVRGNVETRLNLALDGTLDAVMLAWAGLHRLGLHGHVTERLEPPHSLPAVGQGALGIECRRDDARTIALLAALDDPATHRAVLAERRALAELEGGCMIPLAAWGRDIRDEEGNVLLALDAAVFDPDGKVRVLASLDGSIEAPDDLGRRVANVLREHGAMPLLERVREQEG